VGLQWQEMRSFLWPSASGENAKEISDLFQLSLGPKAVFVAFECERILMVPVPTVPEERKPILASGDLDTDFAPKTGCVRSHEHGTFDPVRGPRAEIMPQPKPILSRAFPAGLLVFVGPAKT
jgi:hypothetical protein